jgi:hypothetical protein
MSWPFSPARRGWTLNTHPFNHTVAHSGGNFDQQLSLQQSQLGSPSRGTGSDRELSFIQRDGLGMFSHFSTDQANPLSEYLAISKPGIPAMLGGDPTCQPAQGLWITSIGARA